MKIAGRMFVQLVLLLVTGFGSAFGQNVVRGRVLTADAQTPLVGASVQVTGTSVGTLTNSRGDYSLTVPAGGASLTISSIGYRTQTVAIADRSIINVSLETLPVSLEQILVVGYTAQQRRNVSDAVAVVTAEQLENVQAATLESALRGRVAGVNVVSSGEPGRGSQVVVRGQNFIGNVSPLYVIDGMYTRQNPNLNPVDVESIQVLKDASAAAQYGAQAANGVIVIKTKRGRPGETKFALRSYYGFQEVPKRIELADAQQWAAINIMARQNAGLTPFPAALNPEHDTDWQDAILQRGAIQDHNLTMSGGGESATYLLSGSVLREEGTIIRTGFDRYSLRLNSELRRGILTLGENIAFSRSLRDNMNGFPLIDAMRMQPTIPVRDPDSPSGWGFGTDDNPTFGTNPVGAIERQDNRDVQDQVLGTLYAQVAPFHNLSYRINLGGNFQNLNWRNFLRAQQVRQNTVPAPTELTDRRDNTSSLLWEHLLTFSDVFGKHQLNAVAGLTEQREEFRRLEAYRRGFPSDDLDEIDAGTAQFSNRGYLIENVLRSYLVRANYSFADKYLVTGSFRRDGSSRFGPDNRYGDFASASVGWVLSSESFYQGIPFLSSHVDYLKLRASRGKLGNQDIGDYQYAASIVVNQSYPFGADQIGVGATQLNLANPQIKWQDNTQTNVGMDLNLFNSRLALNLDYYVSESGGLLVRAPLPWSLGSLDAPYVNAGSVRNKGFEVGANYHHEAGDLAIDLGANLTTVSNEVLELGNGGQPIFAGPFGVARTEVGGPIGTFFVLKTDGIFQSAAEVTAHQAQPNAKPGDVRYVDINGDKLINDEDRYVAGSAVPDIEGGLSLGVRYRAWDFALAMRGASGSEIFNVAKFWSDRMDENSNYRAELKPWTPDNPSNTTPRAVFGTAGNDNARTLSDRWIEDGSFLRIQNLTLGYALPPSLFQNLRLGESSGRVYLSIQNLHTFTGFSNWDPEVLGFDDPLARGVDDGRIYPNPRTITIGVDFDM